MTSTSCSVGYIVPKLVVEVSSIDDVDNCTFDVHSSANCMNFCLSDHICPKKITKKVICGRSLLSWSPHIRSNGIHHVYDKRVQWGRMSHRSLCTDWIALPQVLVRMMCDSREYAINYPASINMVQMMSNDAEVPLRKRSDCVTNQLIVGSVWNSADLKSGCFGCFDEGVVLERFPINCVDRSSNGFPANVRVRVHRSAWLNSLLRDVVQEALKPKWNFLWQEIEHTLSVRLVRVN